jgi:hypothetical protein
MALLDALRERMKAALPEPALGIVRRMRRAVFG